MHITYLLYLIQFHIYNIFLFKLRILFSVLNQDKQYKNLILTSTPLLVLFSCSELCDILFQYWLLVFKVGNF